MKEKKRFPAGVLLFVIGLLLVAIYVPVDTGIDYGFDLGINEGVKKGGISYLLIKMLGEQFKIDLFFDPLGYVLVLAGLGMTKRRGIYVRNCYLGAGLGFAGNVIRMVLPFVMNQYRLLRPLLVFGMIELGSNLLIMYSFAMECKKQVDHFLHMEVEKDLVFATELYGFAVLFSNITLPFAVFYFYFARGVYLLLVVISVCAALYYAWKTIYYTRKLSLFSGENEKKEG